MRACAGWLIPMEFFRDCGMISSSDGSTPKIPLEPSGRILTGGVPLYMETTPFTIKHWPVTAGLVLQPCVGSSSAAFKAKERKARVEKIIIADKGWPNFLDVYIRDGVDFFI